MPVIPGSSFFTVIQDQVTRRAVVSKKKSCREWVGGVLQVTGQKYVSKYVSYIERWFRIERDGLTVTWIMLPDQKCLSRNRFSKELVNNMPLYSTAVNYVLACLNPTFIYNKKSVGQF